MVRMHLNYIKILKDSGFFLELNPDGYRKYYVVHILFIFTYLFILIFYVFVMITFGIFCGLWHK